MSPTLWIRLASATLCIAVVALLSFWWTTPGHPSIPVLCSIIVLVTALLFREPPSSHGGNGDKNGGSQSTRPGPQVLKIFVALKIFVILAIVYFWWTTPQHPSIPVLSTVLVLIAILLFHISPPPRGGSGDGSGEIRTA